MDDEKRTAIAKEIIRQRDEAKKIGQAIRTITRDMCRSRNVSYDFAAEELMTHALSMSKSFIKETHQGLIEEHGKEGFSNFNDVFSRASLRQFINAGNKISDHKNNPSTFGILSGDKLNNENLAQCLFLKNGISVSSQSDKGFKVGREGEFFTIYVSVQDDVVSFFDYEDVSYCEDGDPAWDCARYNNRTYLSKAHIMKIDKPQIHFTYLYPHSGTVIIEDIKTIALTFINECTVEGQKINWGNSD